PFGRPDGGVSRAAGPGSPSGAAACDTRRLRENRSICYASVSYGAREGTRMAEDDDDAVDLDAVDEATLPAGLRRELRRARKDAKDAAEQRAQNEALLRELAFARAGITGDEPGAKWFMKGYDADMDPEAIRIAAIEANVIGNHSPVTPAEQAGHSA